jgi:hypothetical protein
VSSTRTARGKRRRRTTRASRSRGIPDFIHATGARALSTEFLDETIGDWQPLSRRLLTREDAREIVENLTGFFRVLNEWRIAEERRTRRAISTVD